MTFPPGGMTSKRDAAKAGFGRPAQHEAEERGLLHPIKVGREHFLENDEIIAAIKALGRVVVRGKEVVK